MNPEEKLAIPFLMTLPSSGPGGALFAQPGPPCRGRSRLPPSRFAKLAGPAQKVFISLASQKRKAQNQENDLTKKNRFSVASATVPSENREFGRSHRPVVVQHWR